MRARANAGGNAAAQALVRRHIRDELAVLVLGRECVQKTANVNLIPGEVAADGVGINGEAH